LAVAGAPAGDFRRGAASARGRPTAGASCRADLKRAGGHGRAAARADEARACRGQGSDGERGHPFGERAGDGRARAAAPDPTGRRDAGETHAGRSATRAQEATPPPPAREAEPPAVAPPRPPQSETSRDVRRTAPLTARPEVREETAKAPGPPLAAAPQSAETFGSARALGPADVSGQLRVGDRAAAREALAALAARLGGVQLSPPGQGGDATAEVVEVLVPRGAYRDLTDALAKLGQWRPEREPTELPPMVRVTLHIVD
jgi:hypothetical protein